jgi:acyl-CoA thioesterase
MPKASRWHQPRKWRLPTTGTWEERLAEIQSWDLHPYWRLLGVEVVGLGPASSKLHVAVDPEKHGAWPHGGLLSSLVDMSVAIALFAAYGPEDDDVIAHATADLNVTFVDAAEDSDIFAEGRIVRKARTAAFGAAEVRDGSGRLVALGRATFLIRRESTNG